MTNIDIFKIWAPIGVKWTEWVRPVPFISINERFKINEFCDCTIPNVNYINTLFEDAAIIIDLPGNDSIREGLALAKIGYRPIPIYNGTNEQESAIATTDNHTVEFGLVWGAMELKNINIQNNATPVFLLDSNRMHRFKMSASVFDNSWDIYNQDIPSADYFLKNGINKIIIRGEKINSDLNKILYKFQKKGIKILFTNGYENPKEVTIKKPLKKEKY